MTRADKIDRLLVYGGGVLFILANALLMMQEFYFFLLFPLLLVVFYYAFFSLDKLFMAVVFLTPLSVELSRFTGTLPFDISLPTEPLILIILMLALLRLIRNGSFNGKIFFHPVSLSLYFYLAWLLVTSLTSTMPLVSVKFFLVRFWFVAVFFFLGVRIFSRRRNINIFLWCYIAALLIVIMYSLYRHAGYGFLAQRAAHWVVRPFYNDHTAYGAVIAMFIPVIAVFAFRRKGTALQLWIPRILLAIFSVALVFSYSRAAWLSLIFAFFVWVVIRLRISFGRLLSFSLVAVFLIFMLRHDIVREMESNTQDSSSDLREHMRSVTNITSDASNLERINRWKSALAMFREKPLLGWGPGTYMFQYAPYQLSYDRTIISTNFGEGGDAHSEYLGPLSESGLPGMISIMVVALVILLTGFRLLRELKKGKERNLVMGVLLGLITYLVHGTLNNFLHSDKAAVPFWGFAAILVAIDLYRKNQPNSSPRMVISSKIARLPSITP